MRVCYVNRTNSPMPTKVLTRMFRRAQALVPARARSTLPEELGVIFVTAQESRRLNRRYRGEDRPATVLTFPYGREAEIVMSPAAVRRWARESRSTYQEALFRMVLHGFLHLAGLKRPPGHPRAFLAREQRLWRQLGIRSDGR